VSSNLRNLHVRAFVCEHVLDRSRRALVVGRPWGDWQLLCGQRHADDPYMVGLAHLVEADPTLNEVLDLAEGCEARREHVGGPWKRGRCVTDG
jgi:hypothetical protein